MARILWILFHWVPEAMAMICDQILQKLHHWRIHLNTQDSQILNPEMVLTSWHGEKLHHWRRHLSSTRAAASLALFCATEDFVSFVEKYSNNFFYKIFWVVIWNSLSQRFANLQAMPSKSSSAAFEPSKSLSSSSSSSSFTFFSMLYWKETS